LGKIRKEYYYITECHLNMRVSVKLDIEATVISMYKYFSLQLKGVDSSLCVPRQILTPDRNV